MTQDSPPSANKSHAGVSRSLFSKLNSIYTMAKSKLPSVATSPLQRIESGVADLIERNVSPISMSSLESRLDNLIAPQMTKLDKVAQFAQNIGNRATPVVNRLEKNIISTIEVIDRSKKRFNDLIENAKQVPQHLQDRATTLALDSIKRIDTAFDFILPETELPETLLVDAIVDPQEPVQLADGDIQEIVQRSIVLSSKNLLGKVNKRVQKRVWQRVASAQGFMKRRTVLMHTSLMDYASTMMDRTVPDDVRAMYAAVLEFPTTASEVYTKLANEGSVCGTEFRAALQQSMGSTWHKAMGPAAVSYCEVVNRVLQARAVVLQARQTTTTQVHQVLEHAATTTNNTYTVVTERAAIVFNTVAPAPLREAATAYLKRVDDATKVSVDDSFLRNFSSKIAAVVLLARNDLQETYVRLYDPIKNKWESQANFDFGRNLVSLLSKVPMLNFSKVYGFIQALVSLEQIKKMRDLADKMVSTVRSPVEQVIGDIATTVTSFKNKPALAKNVEQVSNDATSIVIPLDVMAEHVYALLSNDGTPVDFDTFLSALRVEFEQASGTEWKSTLLSPARRIFSLLGTGDDVTSASDPTSIVIPLDVLAEHVYAILSNDGTPVDLDTFLSALRVEFEQASGTEWKSTLLSPARRIFSQLNTADDESQEVNKSERMHDASSPSEEEADQAE